MELTEKQKKKIIDCAEGHWEYDSCWSDELFLGNDMRVFLEGDDRIVELTFYTGEDDEVKIEGAERIESEIKELYADLCYEHEQHIRDLAETENSLGYYLVSQGNYMGA